jgi:Uma2 family endonuclease
VPTDPLRKRWTRAECAALESTGLWDQQKLELIEAELISNVGKNRPRVNVMALVQAWMIRVFGAEFVNSETTIDVAPEDNPTSEPQPDIIVLNRSTWEFPEGNPKPEDIRLLIEISDTSVGFDLTTKAVLYGRAGICEYWVFDVGAGRLIVHRDPAQGLYKSVAAYRREESVAPRAAPDQQLRVGDVFGDQGPASHKGANS